MALSLDLTHTLFHTHRGPLSSARLGKDRQNRERFSGKLREERENYWVRIKVERWAFICRRGQKIIHISPSLKNGFRCSIKKGYMQLMCTILLILSPTLSFAVLVLEGFCERLNVIWISDIHRLLFNLAYQD